MSEEKDQGVVVQRSHGIEAALPDEGDGLAKSRDVFRPRFFGLLLAIFCLCHAFELTHFTITVDEEILAFHSPEFSLRIYRWALYYFKVLVWPQSSVPYGVVLQFGICAVFSYLLTLRAFEVVDLQTEHFALFPIFVAFPVWSAHLEMSVIAVGAGPALLAATYAARLCLPDLRALHRRDAPAPSLPRWLRLPVAVLAIAFAVGIYPGFLLNFVVLGFALSLWLFATAPLSGTVAHARGGLLVVFLGIAGFCLSWVIGRAAMGLHGLKPHHYVDNFNQLSTLLERPGWVLHRMADFVFMTYVGFWNSYGLGGVVCALFFLSGSALLVRTRPARGLRRDVVLAATMVVICLVPFGFNPTSRGVVPIRSLVAVPTVVWLFGFLPLKFLPDRRTRRFVLILAAAMFMMITYVQSVIQARAWVGQRHDQHLAAQIYYRVVEAWDAPVPEQGIAIETQGGKVLTTNYPLLFSSTNGASIFGWDGGNRWRIFSFMNLMGYSDLRLADPVRSELVRPAFTGMPVWPEAGSVQRVDDIVLIKLSEPVG